MPETNAAVNAAPHTHVSEVATTGRPTSTASSGRPTAADTRNDTPTSSPGTAFASSSIRGSLTSSAVAIPMAMVAVDSAPIGSIRRVRTVVTRVAPSGNAAVTHSAGTSATPRRCSAK